jgi:hypothetical protein
MIAIGVVLFVVLALILFERVTIVDTSKNI